ncbi:MAG: hypothetical protein HY369_05240 [Candidatus Aenigmarchaeota archaeon]|nr:hypothetical protein [Candidatus Aenigmarchaeota archaeon]
MIDTLTAAWEQRLFEADGLGRYGITPEEVVAAAAEKLGALASGRQPYVVDEDLREREGRDGKYQSRVTYLSGSAHRNSALRNDTVTHEAMHGLFEDRNPGQEDHPEAYIHQMTGIGLRGNLSHPDPEVRREAARGYRSYRQRFSDPRYRESQGVSDIEHSGGWTDSLNYSRSYGLDAHDAKDEKGQGKGRKDHDTGHGAAHDAHGKAGNQAAAAAATGRYEPKSLQDILIAGGREFVGAIALGVQDGAIRALRESGKPGQYLAALIGNYTYAGALDHTKPDTIVAVKKRDIPGYSVSLVKTHGTYTLTADDVTVTNGTITLPEGQGFELIGGDWEKVYDYNLFEKLGSAQTFPGFREMPEREIRRLLVEDTVRYLVNRPSDSQRVDEQGRVIRVVRPKNFDLGLGTYITAQGLIAEPILGGYNRAVKIAENVVTDVLPMVGIAPKPVVGRMEATREAFVRELTDRTIRTGAALFDLDYPLRLAA